MIRMAKKSGVITRIDKNFKELIEWEIPKARRESGIDNHIISPRETTRMLSVLLKETIEGNRILNDLKVRPRKIR